MFSSAIISSRTRFLCNVVENAPIIFRTNNLLLRWYAKKSDDDGCRKAYADMPPEVDPNCPRPCDRRKKKKGILHRIKLRVIEGGTNFGTPFRRVDCDKKDKKLESESKLPAKEETKALPPPEKKVPALPPARPGVQVSVLGADTAIGRYVALLLKQCPCIKKLRLYEAKDSQGSECGRNLTSVVQDLQHINTNCLVQAFSCACYELERCLQNTDIVLMLESGSLSPDLPFEKRFCYQAPIVKRYAEAISTECPKAFIIVCATPIDCMVPLVSETLNETGWYDPRKILGSLAVPEMRASTLAARALCLEPRYTRVPCVGGTEGEALVPLFSKAVEYFDFATYNAEMLTEAVRKAPQAMARCDGTYTRATDLSEAHALAGLVTKVAHALLCHDIPRLTGFVATDASQVLASANYFAFDVLLNHNGICKRLDVPGKLNPLEIDLLECSMAHVESNVHRALNWYSAAKISECQKCQMTMRTQWHIPRHYDHLDDCTFHLT